MVATTSNNIDTSATTTTSSSPIASAASSLVAIRALQESDIPTLLEAESYSQSFLDAAVLRVDWSDRKLRVLVAEDPETKRLAGHVAVGLGYPEYFPQLDDAAVRQLYLANITVRPEFRRRGIGLQLLRFLKARSSSSMPAPLGLETREQRAVFVTYMGLWVGYGLLNELAKRRDVHFNSTSAVVLQSLLKLAIATYMFLSADARERGGLLARVSFLAQQVTAHRALLLRYLVPSGLYVLYDVLSYVNLRQFDAPTYFLLLQFRMVVTGVLHQFMFQRRLNRNQWASLAVTTLGCAVKTLGSSYGGRAASHHPQDAPPLFAYGLLLVQMLSSTFAGVYNEVLLKKQTKIPLNLQNIFMYLDSIACTVAMLVLGLTGQSFAEVVRPSELRVLFSFYVLPMVLIMAFIGVVTSFFLKVLDSVRKAIASALELVFLPLLSAVLFGVPLTLPMVASVAFVGSGVYIYSLPMKPDGASTTKSSDHDGDVEKGTSVLPLAAKE